VLPAELILVRHGRSAQNAGLTTDLNSPLTDLGRQQAAGVTAQLAKLDLRGWIGVTSPYLRARQTAEQIAAATGVPLTIDDAVREWGQTITIDRIEYPHEPIEDVVRRLERFLVARQGQRCLIVSPGTPIALLTQLARREQPTIVGSFWEGVENCCLRRVTPGPAGAGPSGGGASP
jgi:broad specificity phosphatase PhoE